MSQMAHNTISAALANIITSDATKTRAPKCPASRFTSVTRSIDTNCSIVTTVKNTMITGTQYGRMIMSRRRYSPRIQHIANITSSHRPLLGTAALACSDPHGRHPLYTTGTSGIPCDTTGTRRRTDRRSHDSVHSQGHRPRHFPGPLKNFSSLDVDSARGTYHAAKLTPSTYPHSSQQQGPHGERGDGDSHWRRFIRDLKEDDKHRLDESAEGRTSQRQNASAGNRTALLASLHDILDAMQPQLRDESVCNCEKQQPGWGSSMRLLHSTGLCCLSRRSGTDARRR